MNQVTSTLLHHLCKITSQTLYPAGSEHQATVIGISAQDSHGLGALSILVPHNRVGKANVEALVDALNLILRQIDIAEDEAAIRAGEFAK